MHSRPGRISATLAAIVGAFGVAAVAMLFVRENPGKARPPAAPAEAGEAQVERLRQIRQRPHRDGWSRELRDLVRAAASTRTKADGAPRSLLQTEAVAAAVGLDARLSRRIPDAGGYFVAADHAGTNLLLGGVPISSASPRQWSARLLLHVQPPALPLAGGGMGPVAFRRDDTPMQLLARPGEAGRPDELSLIDPKRGAVAIRFEIPGQLAIESYQELGLAPDASAVAAPVRGTDGTVRLTVWAAESPRPRFAFPRESCCLAFTADGAVLAAGNRSGGITAWLLAAGEPLADWPSAGSGPVRCLAFGPSRRERRGGDPAGQVVWPLAWSEAPGTIRIRPVSVASPPNREASDREMIAQTSPHEIAALAFSPDGSLLASCGEDRALIWDPATGRRLLSVDAAPDLQAVAFSPAGRDVAFCSVREDGPGITSVWSLRDGGPISLLRGATVRLVACAASPEPQAALTAAWARDGQVFVWAHRSGMLRQTLPTPAVPDEELPSLAFAPDGRRLAFLGGGEARLWDLGAPSDAPAPAPGPARVWSLTGPLRESPGVWTRFSALRFAGGDRLLAIHVDAEQVLRAEDLGPALSGAGVSARRRQPMSEVRDLGGNVTNLTATPDGSVILIAVALTAQPGVQAVKAYRTATGERLWAIPLPQPPRPGSALQLAPDGTLLAVLPRGDAPALLIDVATGEPRNMLLPVPLALGPGARSWLAWTPRTADAPGGVQFCEAGRTHPAFAIPGDLIAGLPAAATFTPDGQLAIWINGDNTVTACDLAALKTRLAADGLGW